MYTALATDIKSFATNELGFDLVGITTAEPLAGASNCSAGWRAEPTVKWRTWPRRPR